jgi:hypothetical protein
MIVAHIMGIPVEESVLYVAAVAAVAPTLLVVMRGRALRLGRGLRRRRSLSD